ncbi:MAG: IscA/HesB family protein [Proteobacteria bacterium]|nr:IscA/HesB family protein [Pseudomonadota bacterium]MBU1611872.1 IscA/HesB family protein [Pseudomonadota bacterium]
MIDMTDAAKAKIAEYFQGKDIEPVRIYLAMGCGGAQLALALDAAKDTDEVAKIGDYSVVVDKKLYEEGKTFTIDASPMGFAVESDLVMPEAPSGTGSCGSCCGGCG